MSDGKGEINTGNQQDHPKHQLSGSIAITADVHLRGIEEAPERYKALKDIFSQISEKGIENLIIAGDLFDAEYQNYKDFDGLLKQFHKIHTYIIPGNHDEGISQQYFAADNLTVLRNPKIENIEGITFLFVPYLPGKSMGEIIAGKKEELGDKWTLVGHGDYLEGRRKPNPYEPGIYMPLTRSDLEYYQPSKVILGHIHQYFNTDRVYYSGSPCGLDINETGKRQFLTISADPLDICFHCVDTDKIYFNESLISLPITNELEYIKEQIRKKLENWNLEEGDEKKTIVRLKVKGYTSDKRKLKQLIEQELKAFSFYKDEGPDLSEVSTVDSPEITSFIEQVKDKIDSMNWDEGHTHTKKEDILEKALHIILS